MQGEATFRLPHTKKADATVGPVSWHVYTLHVDMGGINLRHELYYLIHKYKDWKMRSIAVEKQDNEEG
jgi:hypothetical protein